MNAQDHSAFLSSLPTRPSVLGSSQTAHTSLFLRRSSSTTIVLRHSHRRYHHARFQATAPAIARSSSTEENWSAKTNDLYLYNTLTRSKEMFSTVEPGIVRFYSCGPTVYDFAHIGNFRAFLTYDVIKRWLLFKGYDVRHVMNITDVDDKIIRKVQQLGCTATELTEKYAEAFFADLDLLNVIKAQHYPRATQHIPEIEEVVNGLKKQGFAYERDGSTYFAVSNFGQYGRLAQLEKREKGSLAAVSTADSTDNDEYDKEDLRDFALWKTYKQEDGDVYWDTTLGRGRPGWHIECSCMAMKYLGPELDIHGGGIDLVFPHHENEIAQSEALTGKPFSRFWLHNGFVNIDNEKMSKSLGNFRTLRDVVKKPDDARAFRYMVVTSQYRSALAFTEQSLKSARSTVKRLDALQKRLEQAAGDHGESEITEVLMKARSDFCSAMDDDLNTPRAAAAMFSIVNASEKMLKEQRMGRTAAQEILLSLDEMDRVFGICYTPDLKKVNPTSDNDEAERPPAELQSLLEQRAKARKAKDYKRADKIRDMITAAGFCILDTPQGATLKKL